MPNEVIYAAAQNPTWPTPPGPMYFVVFTETGSVWAGTGFEMWGTQGHTAADYAQPMTQAGPGLYIGSFPAGMGAGRFTAVVREQIGTAPADTDPVRWGREIEWSGTSEVRELDEIMRTGENVDAVWRQGNELALRGEWRQIDSMAQVVMGGNGPGEHVVTVQIQSTERVPMGGVRVWVNSVNDRTGSVVRPEVTNTGGEVRFGLQLGVRYFVFCFAEGWTFAAASIFPQAQELAFIRDIGTELGPVGESVVYERGFITRGIAMFRQCVDEPSINAKYTDEMVLERLEQAYAHVLAEMHRSSVEPVISAFEVQYRAGTQAYQLPLLRGGITAIYTMVKGGKQFLNPHGIYNVAGRGVWVDGDVLRVQDGTVGPGQTIYVEYIAGGTTRLHTGECAVAEDGQTVTLGIVPRTGILDTRASAYVGSILRILGADGQGGDIQERQITEYDATARTVRLLTPLSPVPVPGEGSVYYEIVPSFLRGFDTTVAIYAAWEVAVIESPARAAGILNLYRVRQRDVRLAAAHSNLQSGHKAARDGHRTGR